MRAYQAHIEARASFEKALIEAGLKRGTSLTPEQLKSETDPVFWFISLTSKDASEKETYVTYEVTDITRIAFGDGECLIRQVEIALQVYTRKTKVDTLMLEIEDKVIAEKWTFELESIEYDASNKMFVYSVKSRAEVF